MRKFVISEHPDISGLYKIAEPDNPDFEKMFDGDGVRKTNIFPDYNDAVDWLDKRICEKHEIRIIFIKNPT